MVSLCHVFHKDGKVLIYLIFIANVLYCGCVLICMLPYTALTGCKRSLLLDRIMPAVFVCGVDVL